MQITYIDNGTDEKIVSRRNNFVPRKGDFMRFQEVYENRDFRLGKYLITEVEHKYADGVIYETVIRMDFIS